MIDWILAERIAVYVAGRGDASPPPSIDLAPLAAESEQRVTAYTGLTPARPLPPPEGIERREWIATNISGMRKLLDPVLEKAGQGLGPLKPAARLALGVVVTTEVAVVLGYLAQRVLGQYELVLLEETDDSAPPRLLFVLPNLGHAVEAFGADEREFMTWVALHEVTHAVQFAGVPWLHGHMAGLVKELMDRAELRMDRGRKLRLPSRAEVRRVGSALRQGDLIGLFADPVERETIDRVQAVMAVIEGHAEHVMDAVAPDLLPSLPKLRAALDRRRQSQSGLSRLLGRLLGLELKMRQYEQGKYFCDQVVARVGVAGLHHVFSGPQALPTLIELRDPPAWLRRVGLDGLPAAEVA
ncbi:MAG TPA: zinc-dependent metalloprotease [Solirubrobacteraceae bacterium]|nr:zinc-dependent metalloprotease [Solirubrobacteraceae bacterium]